MIEADPCDDIQGEEVELSDINHGFSYGIDDDNQIFEVNPGNKETNMIFETELEGRENSNGVAP